MTNEKTQIVMITGAAGNLGSAVAKKFASSSASLVLFDHKNDRLKAMFPDLEKSPNHRFVESVDLTNTDHVNQEVIDVINQLRKIDILVNTVGGFRMGSKVHETEPSTWDLMMKLNVKTLLNTCRAVVPHMLDRKRGKIINIGARPSLEGKPKMGAYSAAKSAVLRLTESMSAELKSEGINVNCILPGTIDTPQNREAMPQANFEHWVAPESLADVIYFLTSDAGRDIHGAAVPVYGG